MNMKIEEIIGKKNSELNIKVKVKEIVSQSPLGRAVELLKANGEENIAPSDITIIPVLVAGTEGAVTINFLSPKAGDSPKKGTNVHRLNIQKIRTTSINPGNITSAASLGFDTDPEGLVAIVNSRRPVFFHKTAMVVSEEQTRLPIKKDVVVEVPLFVPIPFTDEKNKKGVLIVTRFPHERIDVSSGNELDSPIGNVDPGTNVMRRKDTTIAPQKPEIEKVVSVDTEFDVNRDKMLAMWAKGRYKDVTDRLQSIEMSLDSKKRTVEIFTNMHRNESQYSEADQIFSKLGQKVIELQNSFDQMEKQDNVWFTKQGSEWKLNIRKLEEEREKKSKEYTLPEKHNVDSYIEITARWFLVAHKWAENKRWK